ncbi:helix-turn-helix transcriptional regulator [Nocardioides sp. NPDC000445]|jgi:DNA-binding CsgD family transcriptional regulator/transcriptional regulator with XRE-family HTH domain|uniref:helix-turn-helix transcriptional regulator n=1 Tax=Nocardioides sp. NPDC000445 TaxID=3154257 RepID=UPI00331D5D74
MSVVAPAKSAVFASSGRSGRPRLSGYHRARANDLRKLVAEALRVEPDVLVVGDPGVDYSPDRLTVLARLCVEEAQVEESGDENRARDLFGLALELQVLALDLHEENLVQCNRRLADCAEGLARLRGLPTAQDLVAVVCEELATRCGFGRATISSVENNAWKPRKAFFAEADAAWFDEWVGQTIPLHGHTPEARLLTERRPALVVDTASTQVHEDIIVEAGQSRSYVVAPVCSRGTVVAFIHCDHFPTARASDEVDRDLVWAFADGFGRLHERLVLMERFHAQRAQVGTILDAALRTLPESLGVVPRTGSLGAGNHLELLSELTARESEVLQLMVAGAPNRVIAERLVIAEDTVKSHVKQILRKLGVANRAQAIARAAGTAPA